MTLLRVKNSLQLGVPDFLSRKTFYNCKKGLFWFLLFLTYSLTGVRMRREREGSFPPSSILSTHSCQTSRLLSEIFSRLSWNIWTWILKDFLIPWVSGWPTKGPVFRWASENPEAKGDNTTTTITTKINIHFFQESNNFEGPPSHIQFVDMPVDSSYMDGVGTFLEIQCPSFLNSLSFSEPQPDGRLWGWKRK